MKRRWRRGLVRARVKERTSVKDIGEKKNSLVDDAYAAMRASIRDASFAPGYQASEQEIALRFGMSRTPVHEAAIRLQEDGLVRVLPRRGILIVALSPDDLREIYDVIIALEGQAAELIAAMAETDRVKAADELDARTEEMRAARLSNDNTVWGHADGAFHEVLIDHAQNSRMSRMIQLVNDQSHRVRMLTLNLRGGLDQSIIEHRQIANAIRAGDRINAREAARQHRTRAKVEILPLLKTYGLKHL